MPIELNYLIYGATFVFTILLVEGLYFLIADARAGRNYTNRRMGMLSSGEDPSLVFSKLRRPPPDVWANLGALSDPLYALNNLILRAGLTVPTGRVVMLMIVGSIFLFFGCLALVVKNTSWKIDELILLLSLAASFVTGVGVPLLYLRFLKNRRKTQFEESFPDALDIMVRSLRVGHPVGVSVAIAAEQMPDPIGTELGIAVDEMTYGLELREVLANVSDRVQATDFGYFVVAVNVQHESGGNLAEVLGGLSQVIRSRFRMFRKIHALAAEGRFSAKILGALPFCFAAFVFSVQPDYYLNVSDDPMFWKVALLGLVLQISGIMLMQRMINFRV